MTFCCKLCDKSVMNKSKYKHRKTIPHKTLEEPNIRKYNILTPNFDQIDEIMKRYKIIFNKKI